jgi:uncharacterized protein YidB (DUF937 family)
MGLFDDFVKHVAEAAQTVTAGRTTELAQSMLDLLQERGGIDGLIERFREVGLGDVIASWVANGPNLPITPEELARVLDPEQLRTLSRQAGIAMSGLTETLATLLPALVDRLTPDGEVPGPYQLLRMAVDFLRGDRP